MIWQYTIVVIFTFAAGYSIGHVLKKLKLIEEELDDISKINALHTAVTKKVTETLESQRIFVPSVVLVPTV